MRLEINMFLGTRFDTTLDDGKTFSPDIGHISQAHISWRNDVVTYAGSLFRVEQGLLLFIAHNYPACGTISQNG